MELVFRIYRQIQLGPMCDYIYGVILKVLLLIYHFLHKCSVYGAHNLKTKQNKTKTSLFCAESFCVVYHQNTRGLKLISGYLDISHIPSPILHFILIQFWDNLFLKLNFPQP